tara:strand:+ start:17504 stop:17644 length:141 start_codon:yes stop_codon:yes gene_type:complete
MQNDSDSNQTNNASSAEFGDKAHNVASHVTGDERDILTKEKLKHDT